LFGTSATADEKDIKKSLGNNFESHFISVKKTSMIFHDGLINCWATVGDVIKNHKLKFVYPNVPVYMSYIQKCGDQSLTAVGVKCSSFYFAEEHV